MEQNRIDLYKGLVDLEYITTTTYPNWVKKWFSNDDMVTLLYNGLFEDELYTKDVKSFFRKYACDLLTKSNNCVGYNTVKDTVQQKIVTPQQITKTFSCVQKSSLLSDIPSTVNGENSITYKLPTGGQFQFLNGNKFIYVSNVDTNKKINGTWNCDGENEFTVNTENKARLSSKEGEWKYDVSYTPTPMSNTNIKLLRRGDSGEEVKNLQNLLIQTGHKNISRDGSVDGIFGNRTEQMVKDFQSSNKDKDGNPLKVDGIVGPATMEALQRNKLHENYIKLIVDKNLKSISK